jgi:hypothetical protein
MIRIIIFFVVLAFSKETISQHVLATRIENTSLTQWTENRLKVLVEGHMCSEIVVTATKGKIHMNADDCEIIYTASDTSIRRTKIKIGIKRKNGVNWLQEMELPVLSMPDPTPIVGGFASGSSIPRASFLEQSRITVPIVDGWHLIQIENKQHITRYSVKITRKDSVIFSRTNIEGFLFSQEMLEFAKTILIQDDEITFFEIDTLIYGQERRHLNGTYKLTIK